MRNVASVGQALAPIEFPRMRAIQHDWSVEYPDYQERMQVMSKFARFWYAQACKQQKQG